MGRASTLAIVFGVTASSLGHAADIAPCVLARAIAAAVADGDAPLSARDLLRKGMDDYRRGNYDDASRSFEQASQQSTSLTEREQDILGRFTEVMAAVNKSRKEAAESLDAAHKALTAGDAKQAEELASEVVSNGYMTPEVRGDAESVVEHARRMTGGAPRSSTGEDAERRRQAQQLLATARARLREGNTREAEMLARQADTLRVNYHPLDDTPAKLLKDLNELGNRSSLAADSRAMPATARPPARGDAVSISSPASGKQPSEDARKWAEALVAEALASFDRNQLDRAAELAHQAKELPVNFSELQTTPDQILAAIEKARQAQANAAAASAASAPAPSDSPTAAVPSDAAVETASFETATPADRAAIQTADGISPAGSEPTEPVRTTEAIAPVPASRSGQAAPPSAPRPLTAEQRKAKAKQLLAQARKLMDAAHYDEAEQLLTQCESLEPNWSRWGDSPQNARRDLAHARSRAAAPASAGNSATNSDASRTAGDPHQQALELVRQARAQLQAGQLDEAEQMAKQAEAKHAQYRLLDDTPTKLLRDIGQARAEMAAVRPVPVAPVPVAPAAAQAAVELAPEVQEIPTTRPAGTERELAQQAASLLERARHYLAEGQYDNALAIAERVNAWGLHYGLFADNPSRVASAARAMRSRAMARAARRSGSSVAAAPSNAPRRLEPQAVEILPAAGASAAAGEQAGATAPPVQVPAEVSAILAGAASRPLSNAGSAAPANASGSDGAMNRAEPGRTPPSATSDDAAGAARPMSPATAPPRPNTTAAAAAARPAAPAVNPAQTSAAARVTQKSSEPPTDLVQWVDGARSGPLTPATDPRRRIAQTQPPAGPSRGGDPGIVTASGEEPGRVTVASGRITVGAAAEAEDAAMADAYREKLEQVRLLFQQGNYPAARQAADQVRAASPSLRGEADELVARINVMEQTAALELYEAGVAAAKKKEYDRALAFFGQVAASHVTLDPATEQQLQNYLRDLPAIAHQSDASGTARVANGAVQGAGDDSGLGDAGRQERIKFQQLVTETNQKVQAARRLLTTSPGQAIHDLEAARQNVLDSGLDERYTTPVVQRLDAAIRYATQEKQRIDVESLQDQSRRAAKETRERELAVDAQRQQEVAKLIEQSQAYMKEGKYSDAEVVARRANEIDPENPATVAILFKSQVLAQQGVNKEIQAQKEDGFLKAMTSVDRDAVPWDDSNAVGYPKDWPSISDRRKKNFRVDNAPRSALMMEIEKKLGEPVSFTFTETPLAEVVSFLRDYTGVNIVLDVPSLQADGVSSDRPVTLKLEGVPLKSALHLLLDQLNLDYSIENDVLLITTPLKKQGVLFPKSYNVGDLIVPIRTLGTNNNLISPTTVTNDMSFGQDAVQRKGQRAFPNVGLGQFGGGLGGGGGGGGLGGGGGGLGGGGGGGGLGGGGGGLGGQGQQVDFQGLIDLVKQTVAPNSWDTVGGAGTIQQFEPNLSLVISQTQAVHDQIADLLAQLRRLQDLAVMVEVKFISLSESFFERIGIDFDVDIQSNEQKPRRHFGSATGAVNATTGQPLLNTVYLDHEDDFAVGLAGPREAGSRPQFTSDLKIPFQTSNFAVSRPQDFVPALNFGIAFLSDIEVYLFLEAAQRDDRSNVLTAPKVMLFNGALGFVFSGTVEPFVTALRPIVANGAVAFDPTIQQFFNGATLIVQPVISADRRYVRLNMTPVFTNIIGTRRFQVSGAAGGGGGINVGGGGGGGGANTTTGGVAISSEIVVPIFGLNIISTTVSVPDGGTVVLGGLKTKSETRTEFGVPILNKIPYVNRLFSNTGIETRSNSLLIMVTPRIIIQEEEEELLGKTLSY